MNHPTAQPKTEPIFAAVAKEFRANRNFNISASRPAWSPKKALAEAERKIAKSRNQKKEPARGLA